MNTRKPVLADFSKEQRNKALEKFRMIEPFLNREQSISEISNQENIPLRTLYRWKRKYEQNGLIGLIHTTRSDQGKINVDKSVLSEIERLALKNKKISSATIHRKICSYCGEKHLPSPSYYQVYKAINTIQPSLIKLSHEGEKAYKETYDLIHIRNALSPNEIWQADHTLLDIEVIDEKGGVNKPWLTIILDDYSRAVAGYFVTFSAPTSYNTALTLHQAIWNKKDSDWPICGIQEKFYTDHGSDFTSKQMEQVAVDLRMNLIFSTVGMPRGRGKIERFFQTVNQLLREQLPGYIGNTTNEQLLTIQKFEQQLHRFLIKEYNHRTHSGVHTAPIKKWNDKTVLPNMPDSLESLDLLLLEIPKTRKIHSDGIHFQGLRYTNPNLAAYIGESVLIRYTLNDLVEIRVFYKNKFLCTAIAPNIANYSIDMKDLVSARNKRRNILKEKLQSPSSVDLLVEEKQSEWKQSKPEKKSKLKRYLNE
ncbi:MAG: DDE-type integrase/transposase/recombinase [Alkalibacterium sp.]|nr:DDE-type integrase/transposase/recombinase [Alkalibacterium sp.]MDN6730098.1 DDE-type integrase/transposase/recombinase [Alkalibacterium sp.]